MTFETILYEVRDRVGLITLNRPDALNAVTAQMIDELMEALGQAEGDEGVRALMVTGAGRAFCAGQDVRTLSQGSKEELVDLIANRYPPLILKFWSLEKPIVAAVNGAAMGSGFNLALACDLRLAAENATFGAVFVRIGAGPDSGAAFFLPRLVGTAKAAELLFTGALIDAAEAQRLGIVNRVVPVEALLEEAVALAGRLAQGPRAVGLAKRALYGSLSLDLAQALAYEAQVQAEALATEDFQEGVRAFLEKRPPQFKGR